MNRYIDTEKLINEINDRLVLYLGTAYSVKDTNKVDGLNEALEIVESLQQEQPEVDLDALVDEAFDKYGSVDGYGQLVVSFNRAELYPFIKEIARKGE